MKADFTTVAVSRFLDAVAAPFYDLGIQSARGLLAGQSGMTAEQVLGRLPFMRARNCAGENIFIRPCMPHPYTVLDDLTLASVDRLACAGFLPCARVETSPANFQVWLKHSEALTPELATFIAKRLALEYRADPAAADWRRFGRLPGFTNRKPKHRRPDGKFPFTRLISHSGKEFITARSFYKTSVEQFEAVAGEQQCQSSQRTFSPLGGGRFSHLDVVKFRALPKYSGNPAAADMAFAVAARSSGMPDAQIIYQLEARYLSSDTSERRREAYIARILRKVENGVGSRERST